uniref:Uncharacterized protein n=1 Tax=Arundo donax TaxID=35708 RepID=A0A0A8ZE98_ARUDO
MHDQIIGFPFFYVHAPETWIVNSNTSSWTIVTKNIHLQSSNISNKTRHIISRYSYERFISKYRPWLYV